MKKYAINNKLPTSLLGLLTLLMSMPLVAQQPGYRAGMYPTIWPLEQGNPNRTGSVVNAGLPKSFEVDQLQIESIPMPFPTFTFTRDTNEVFVFGGMPFFLDLYVRAIETGNGGTPDLLYYNQFSPYLTKINPYTLDTLRVDLSGGTGLPYLGGALMHQDSMVYAIANARIFKIDPSDMTVLATLDIPSDSLFIINGFSVVKDGTLIAKSTAFGQGGQIGQYTLIDPESMEIINQVPAITSSARLTIFPDSAGNEFIYHLNRNNTYRMRVLEDSLVLDSTWLAAYAPYGTTENEEPTEPVIAFNRAHYTTNTSLYSSKAMKIFWQSLDQSYELEGDTLLGSFMFTDTITPGWNFNSLAIDDVVTGIILGADQANGKITAIRIDESEQLEYIWEKSYKISSKPTIVADKGLVYLNDFVAEEGFDYVVILDILSGEELGRIKTPGTSPSISSIVVNTNGDVYYCNNEAGSLLGYFNRIFIDSTLVTSVNKVTDAPSDQLRLFQNYPNPFDSGTTIRFELPKASHVKLTVYNILGEQISVILHEHRTAGFHEIGIDGSEYGNGLYFYRIQTDDFQIVKQMMRK